jgi:hypothetical protein
MFKKVPLTVMALAVVFVEVLLFMFYVPSGGDLISPKGDEGLGQLTAILFLLCAGFDAQRYFKKKSAKWSSRAIEQMHRDSFLIEQFPRSDSIWSSRTWPDSENAPQENERVYDERYEVERRAVRARVEDVSPSVGLLDDGFGYDGHAFI